MLEQILFVKKFRGVAEDMLSSVILIFSNDENNCIKAIKLVCWETF